MSTHTFQTQHNDKLVEVSAGYDTMLQRFWLVVETVVSDEELDAMIEAEEEGENSSEMDEGIIYSNLSDNTQTAQSAQSFDYFETILRDLGIATPEAFLPAVRKSNEDEPNYEVEYVFD